MATNRTKVRAAVAAVALMIVVGAFLMVRPDHDGAGWPGATAPNVPSRPSIFAPEPDLERAPTTAVIEGVVKEPDGKPVDGAVVLVTRARDRNTPSFAPLRPSAAVVTAGGGRFRVEGLATGDYGLTAMAAGWAPADKSPVKAEVSSPNPVELVLGRGGLVLSGRVLDAGGGVVPGAAVRATSYSGGTTAPKMFQVRAGDDGVYKLMVGKGSYGLTAEAEGYAPTRDSVMLGRDQTRDLRLMPAARLYGRVVERKTRQPVPDAEVWLILDRRSGIAPTRDVKTDEAGNFAFNDLPPGTFGVGARKQKLVGYSRMVSVAAMQTVDDIEVEVEPGLSVRGRTVDGQGNGVAARVSLYRREPPYDRGLYAKAAEDGKFELAGVLPGQYALDAMAEGYARKRKELQALVADLENEILKLEPEASVSGEVVTAEGKPVAQAQVTAELIVKMEGGGRMYTGRSETTDVDGKFKIAQLEPGDVNARARHPDLGAGAADPVKLGPGEKKTVKIVLGAGASISGRVLYDDGTPAAGVRVYGSLREGASRRNSDDITGPDGSYKLSGLAKGDVQLYPRQEGTGGLMVQPKTVTLVDGEQKTGVDLELPKGGLTIKGQVVAAGGGPVAGASVTLAAERDGRAFRSSSTEQRAFLSGPDGAFTVEDVPKGTYTVWAFHPSHPDGEAKGVAAGTTGLKLQLPAEASVSGIVAGSDGQPVGDYAISLLPGPAENESPADRNRRISMSSFDSPVRRVHDGSGAFSFNRLRAGAYDLKVTTHDGRSGSQVVTVQAGEKKAGVRIVLAAGTKVAGKVVELDGGRPLPGAAVFAGSMAMGSRGQRTTTDAQGTFAVENVPTDQPIRLSVSMEGYVNESREVDAQKGKDMVDAGTIKLMKGDLDEKLQSGTRGLIGFSPSNREGRAVVGNLQKGFPAEKAGVKVGDVILTIDGKDARDLGSGAIMYLLAGKPGTTSVIELASPGGSGRKLTLTRVDPSTVKRE